MDTIQTRSENQFRVASYMWNDLVKEKRFSNNRLRAAYEGSIFHDFLLVLFSPTDGKNNHIHS